MFALRQNCRAPRARAAQPALTAAGGRCLVPTRSTRIITSTARPTMTMFPRSAVIGNTSWCLSAADLESVVRGALLRARRAPRRWPPTAPPLFRPAQEPTASVGGRPVWSADALDEAAIDVWGCELAPPRRLRVARAPASPRQLTPLFRRARARLFARAAADALAAEVSRRHDKSAKAAATKELHKSEKVDALSRALLPILVAPDFEAPFFASWVARGRLDDLPLIAERACEIAHLAYATDGTFAALLEAKLIEGAADAAAAAEQETLDAYPLPAGGRWAWLQALADDDDDERKKHIGARGLEAAAKLAGEAAARRSFVETIKLAVHNQAASAAAGGDAGSAGSGGKRKAADASPAAKRARKAA